MTAPRPTDDKATDYETSRREAMAAARHAIIALREHGYTAGHRRQRYDHMQGESVELPRCPGPQSTEETR